jgi:hypothetical protein
MGGENSRFLIVPPFPRPFCYTVPEFEFVAHNHFHAAQHLHWQRVLIEHTKSSDARRKFSGETRPAPRGEQHPLLHLYKRDVTRGQECVATCLLPFAALWLSTQSTSDLNTHRAVSRVKLSTRARCEARTQTQTHTRAYPHHHPSAAQESTQAHAHTDTRTRTACAPCERNCVGRVACRLLS